MIEISTREGRDTPEQIRSSKLINAKSIKQERIKMKNTTGNLTRVEFTHPSQGSLLGSFPFDMTLEKGDYSLVFVSDELDEISIEMGHEVPKSLQLKYFPVPCDIFLSNLIFSSPVMDEFVSRNENPANWELVEIINHSHSGSDTEF